MRIHLVQLSVNENDIEENLQKALDQLAVLEGGGLAILPELFLSGYLEKNIIDNSKKSGEFIAKFQQAAVENKIAVVGTFSVLENGKRFNRAVFITDKGEIISHYDKTHLFKMMGEDRYFSVGNEFSVFEYNGWKIGINICYDIRFPEAQRSLYHQGVELIILPAAWPHARIDVLKKLSYARAIENQCYFIALNQASASLENKSYGGNSMVIDPAGKLLAECELLDQSLSLSVNKGKIREYRDEITCQQDRRDDIYI